jgi:hypothetical protein
MARTPNAVMCNMRGSLNGETRSYMSATGGNPEKISHLEFYRP